MTGAQECGGAGSGLQYGRADVFLIASACLAGAACLNFLPWIFAFWGTDPESLRESYNAVFYLQRPALFLLESSPLAPLWGWEEPGRVAQLVADGEEFFQRVGHLLALLVHWLPWAFLLGLTLAFGLPRGAKKSGASNRTEQRRMLLCLLLTEAPWWILFLVAAPLKEVDWLNYATFFLALPAAKLIQVHAVLRAAIFLGLPRKKTVLAGLVAGSALVYWLPFLLVNEEFQRAEELRQERKARRGSGESGPSS